MKTGRRILSLLLSLMLVLCAVSVGGISAAAAEEYDLWVGGVRVTDDNKDDVLGDGTVSYDPVSGTLTLNNATITGENTDIKIDSGVSNLTIALVGNNVIADGSVYGIFTYDDGNLKITGNGTLDVSADTFSIHSDGTLTIENASVVAKSNRSYSIHSKGNMTIENASVVATSNGAYSINSDGNMTVENASVVATSNGYFSIYGNSVLTVTNSYVSAESNNCPIYGVPLVLGEGLGITEPIGGQNNGSMITLNNQNVKKAVIQPAYSVELSANPSGGGTVSGSGFYAKDGSTATVTATPNENYRFVNWTENGEEVSTDAEYSFTVTGDRELVANFERVYTVKFVNDDGTELQSSSAAYGETPVYTGETPTKEATAQYTYSFLAWTPAIVPVTEDATYTATYSSTPVDYKLTWKVDGESYKNETVPFGTEISKPDDPAKEGYTFEWVDEIPATMPAQDVTINGKFTAIEYTATFVDENGGTVKAVKFTVETKKLDEPEVPEKARYAGEWEEYTLGTSDITIKPVYENITSIRIDDFEENTEIGYKENMIFRASTADMPEGAEIHWFVNGEDVGTGEGLGVEEPTEDYTVQAKVLDKDGSVLAESGTMNVKVRNGFFDRLLAFFSSLFDKIFGGALSDLFGSIC